MNLRVTRFGTDYRVAAVSLGVFALLTSCAVAPPAADSTGMAAYERAWTEAGRAADADPEAAFHQEVTLIESPLFAQEQESARHDHLLQAARLGMRMKDAAAAHPLFVRSTALPEAGNEDWEGRFESSFGIKDEDDASFALTRLATRWPSSLSRYRTEVVERLALRSAPNRQVREIRFELRWALFQMDWRTVYGVVPSGIWGALTEELVEKGRIAEALGVLPHVHSPRKLLSMQIDKRFDVLTRKAPEAFDIEAAAKREVEDWRAAAMNNPRALDAAVQLSYAYIDVGRYSEAYQITQDVLARLDHGVAFKSVYDDDETSLNWIYGNRSTVLMLLQNWVEAEQAMRAAAERREHEQINVSNVINLAQYLADQGRGDDALEELKRLPEFSPNITPYGKMEWHAAQLGAAVAKGDIALAATALQFLRVHKTDAPMTYQSSLVRADYTNEAVRWLLQRLRDPNLRNGALLQVQIYSDPGAPPELQREREKWRQLVLRDDVQDAINAVGRVKLVALPSP